MYVTTGHTDINVLAARHAHRMRYAVLPSYVGYARLPMTIVQAGYFDDSSHGRFLVLAGYLSDVEVWDQSFAPQWVDALQSGPFPLREYKHTNCRSGRGQFKEWSTEERNALSTKMVEIITHHAGHILGVGAAIAMPARDDDPFRDVRAHRFAYSWAASMLVRSILIVAGDRLQSGDAVHFIFDKQKGLESRAPQVIGVMRELMGESHFRVTGPQFEPSESMAPIQAADLLANETLREMKRRILTPDRPPSTILQTLVAKCAHLATYTNADEMSMFSPQLAGQHLKFHLLYDSARKKGKGLATE